jgi:hypothetical protein
VSDWFNYQATLKILLFSMLAGAALPALFAFGIRLQAVAGGGTNDDGTKTASNPAVLAVAWTIYTVVLVVIIIALLYIARDFIAHHTHYPFLGAKPT